MDPQNNSTKKWQRKKNANERKIKLTLHLKPFEISPRPLGCTHFHWRALRKKIFTLHRDKHFVAQKNAKWKKKDDSFGVIWNSRPTRDSFSESFFSSKNTKDHRWKNEKKCKKTKFTNVAKKHKKSCLWFPQPGSGSPSFFDDLYPRKMHCWNTSICNVRICRDLLVFVNICQDCSGFIHMHLIRGESPVLKKNKKTIWKTTKQFGWNMAKKTCHHRVTCFKKLVLKKKPGFFNVCMQLVCESMVCEDRWYTVFLRNKEQNVLWVFFPHGSVLKRCFVSLRILLL